MLSINLQLITPTHLAFNLVLRHHLAHPPFLQHASPRPPGDNTVELLESLGADVVVTPDVLGNPEDYARAASGLPRPRLGLNCVGGSIATSVSWTCRPSSPCEIRALRCM